MATFYGQTDKTLRIQLQSYLLDLFWGFSECAAGGVVPIEARTAYVADTSDITITVRDMNGGAVETIKGKVYSNYFRKQYTVKPNKTGGIYLDAEMRAHGLKLTSRPMKVLPPVGISGFKFEDDNGNAITEVEDGQAVTMSAIVKGSPEGTKAIITLYAQNEDHSKNAIVSAAAEVKSGKLSCIWQCAYSGDQEQKKTQADLNRDGGKYYSPRYFFEIDCLGTKVLSPPINYAGFLTLNFSNLRGKVTYELPDGTEKTETIPDNGVLKIKDPKVGNVKIKYVEEQKGGASSSNPPSELKREGVKEIILGADEIKEKKAANKPLMEIVTGQVANITVQRSAQVIEMEDALFRHNSAVFLPSGTLDNATQQQVNVNGLDIIRAVYKHLEKDENKNKKLFIDGHTDTSGNEEYNFKLSKLRALAVQYVLTGDRDSWSDQYKERQNNGVQTYRDEDIQHILKWTNIVRGWSCDPGGIDGITGPKTQAAIKKFQDSYNKDFGKSITVDGMVGKQTWGAIFDVYQEQLAAKLETDAAGLANLKNKLKWANSDDKDKSTVGCGESFPIDSEEKHNYRSQTNRRVELLLFEENEIPNWTCSDGECESKNCPVYNPKFFKKTYLEYEAEDTSEFDFSV